MADPCGSLAAQPSLHDEYRFHETLSQNSRWKAPRLVTQKRQVLALDFRNCEVAPGPILEGRSFCGLSHKEELGSDGDKWWGEKSNTVAPEKEEF